MMITHKFQEVMSFADEVTVLRKGRLVGHTKVKQTNPDKLAEWMMGEARIAKVSKKRSSVENEASVGLEILRLSVTNDRGTNAVSELSFSAA